MPKNDYKEKVIKQFAKSEKDVGSIEVQVGVLSARVKLISEHLKSFPKDKHSRAGLLKIIGKRNKFYKYLQRKDKASFDKIAKEIKNIKNT